MPTKCFIPVLGKRLRVTTLDNCGAYPDPGTEDAMLTTDGFISVTLTAETEDGTEIITRKADGSLCVNEKAANSFKRFTVEIEFCGVNPSLLAMVTNAEPYLDYNGDVAGFTVPEGDIDDKFALELWTGLSGQACAEGAEDASGYLLLPFVNGGTLGDITIDGENAVTFSLTGAYTKGGNAWGVGPYEVVMDDAGSPAVLPLALDPYDHLLMIDTGVAPPPAACDPQPMPGGDAGLPAAVTGVDPMDETSDTTPVVFTITGANLPATAGAYRLSTTNTPPLQGTVTAASVSETAPGTEVDVTFTGPLAADDYYLVVTGTDGIDAINQDAITVTDP